MHAHTALTRKPRYEPNMTPLLRTARRDGMRTGFLHRRVKLPNLYRGTVCRAARTGLARSETVYPRSGDGEDRCSAGQMSGAHEWYIGKSVGNRGSCPTLLHTGFAAMNEMIRDLIRDFKTELVSHYGEQLVAVVPGHSVATKTRMLACAPPHFEPNPGKSATNYRIACTTCSGVRMASPRFVSPPDTRRTQQAR